MLKIIEHAKIWIALSLAIIIVGLGFTFTRGLNFGIDFKGGTQVVFEFGKEFDKQKADDIVKKYSPNAVTNTVNNTEYEIKSSDLTTEKVNEIYDVFKKDFKIGNKAIVSQNEIGASIGKELTQKAFLALGVAFICMLIYIAIRFEFKSGLVALAALMHDVLITFSVYAIFDLTINSPFIAAILTIVGYSINATIVIFDRIRENEKKTRRKSSTEIANLSINQTMKRSIYTTITTLFTIVSVYIFVPSVREFAFPIIVGIISGGYSSVLIAPSLWDVIKSSKKKSKAKKAVA